MDVHVRFRPSGTDLVVPRGTLLLDAVRRAGLPIASACGADGLCARCGVRILRGAESLPAEGPAETRAKRANRIDPDLRLACRIPLSGDVEVTTAYWS